MTYKRCDTCRGAKETTGLGMITRKCVTCKGIGYTEDGIEPVFDNKPKDAVAIDIGDNIPRPTPKKRGGNPNWVKGVKRPQANVAG